jgi:hypothetical protein
MDEVKKKRFHRLQQTIVRNVQTLSEIVQLNVQCVFTAIFVLFFYIPTSCRILSLTLCLKTPETAWRLLIFQRCYFRNVVLYFLKLAAMCERTCCAWPFAVYLISLVGSTRPPDIQKVNHVMS